MKWDEEVENLPENIFISKWLPQNEILSHPNIILFISHCGLGGVIESRYHGVPILAVPIYGDQYMNAKEVVKEGRATELDFKILDEENFYKAIIKMIENKT